MRLVRLVAGILLGYGLMVVLITLVQETWFGGVGYFESAWRELILAGFLTFLSAVVGSLVGTAIANGHRAVPAVMSLAVVIETFTLIALGRLEGPLWFDIAGAASLILGILIGAELWIRRPVSAEPPPV